MHIILSRLAKRLYARIAGLRWDIVVFMTAAHFAVSWVLIDSAGGEKISSGDIFWYFYITTATTVGYGFVDHAGRNRPVHDRHRQGDTIYLQ